MLAQPLSARPRAARRTPRSVPDAGTMAACPVASGKAGPPVSFLASRSGAEARAWGGAALLPFGYRMPVIDQGSGVMWSCVMCLMMSAALWRHP